MKTQFSCVTLLFSIFESKIFLIVNLTAEGVVIISTSKFITVKSLPVDKNNTNDDNKIQK